MRYRLTPEADQDLITIWHYTCENWGSEQANAYLGQLERRFNDLADHPGLGKSCDEIRKGYRCLHEGRHLIFYRSNRKRIEIVRVLHDRMDIANLL